MQRSVYARTKSEVIKKMREKIKEIDNGVYSDFSDVTVAAWMDIFLWKIKRSKIKPKTFDGYAEDIDRIKNTGIARMKIKEVRRFHIQQFIQALESDGRPPFIVHRIYRTFRNAVNEAERQNVIQVSYASGISLPKKIPKPFRIFSREEQITFFGAIKGHRLEAMFILAITTGMREGELAALKWKDYKNGSISVTKNAIRKFTYDSTTNKKTGSRIVIQDSPKTAAGIRDIPLMDIAEKALEV
jgi:integrase